MRIFVKLFRHTPGYSALLVCLLAVGVAFSSIGFAFYQSARQQQAEIDAGYTTAAIPFNEESPGFMPVEDGKFKWEAVSMEELLQGVPVDYRLDRRVYLGAVVEGMTAWTPAADMLNYTADAGFPYAASVFAVRCDDVQTSEDEAYEEIRNANGVLTETETITTKSYRYQFTVLKPLYYMDRQEDMPEYVDPATGEERAVGLPPESLLVSTGIANRDGSPLFEVGKTYLIRGDCPIETIDPTTVQFYLQNGAAYSGAEEVTENGSQYEVIAEDELPLYTEFTGSVEAFLNSDEGAFWRDTVIPAVEQNSHAAKLMLTDNVSSLYWFNTGEASVLQGRLFTAEEYRTGQPVCLVSTGYAEKNGLSVGDTLTMDLYHPYVRAHLSSGSDIDGTLVLMDPCLPTNSLDMKEDYTIVGIYTAPASVSGTYAFRPDTIFAPKASVPGVEEFEDAGTYIPLLNSAMIPNGTSEKLSAFLEEKGFGGSLLFFDQGYTEASDAVSALTGSALRLFAAGGVFFVMIAGLFLFLALHKMGPTIRSLRCMGRSSKACWRETQAAMLPMIFAAVVLGTGLSVLLFERIGKLLLSTQLELPVGAILVGAAVELAALLLLEGLLVRRSTKAGLMQRRKRGNVA